jgi:hypothetical protein
VQAVGEGAGQYTTSNLNVSGANTSIFMPSLIAISCLEGVPSSPVADGGGATFLGGILLEEWMVDVNWFFD